MKNKVIGLILFFLGSCQALPAQTCSCPCACPPTAVSGLTANYFPSTDFTGTSVSKVEGPIDFNLDTGWIPPTKNSIGNFSAQWGGSVTVPQSGAWTFYINSDDGSRLWVNGIQIADDWGNHAPYEVSGVANLQANTPYPIHIDYFQGGGGAKMQLSWSGPGVLKQDVPASALSPLAAAPIPASAAKVTGANMGVVVLSTQSDSATLAAYYMQKRSIPNENLFTMNLPSRGDWTSDQFIPEYTRMQTYFSTKPNVQFLALAFSMPWTVGIMGASAAFTLGYDVKWGNQQIPNNATCNQATASSSYYDSKSRTPWNDFKIRPSMFLYSHTLAESEALIDRGVASDRTKPSGTVYMVKTNDFSRNIRYPKMQALASSWPTNLSMKTFFLDTSALANVDLVGKQDVFGYQTGRAWVDSVPTNKFLPGAYADHVTSFGGQMGDDLSVTGGQMSLLRWINWGATGTYGTAHEPCAVLGKFPDSGVLISHYVSNGETLIESYWKSVLQPGEGNFVGEPLASPFLQ